MEGPKYASIKKSVNNDGREPWEATEFQIKIHDTREEAVLWLLQKYEYWDSSSGCSFKIIHKPNNPWHSDTPEWKTIHNFFMTSGNNDALFQWEWKRRGNCRSYKIVQFVGELKFYGGAENSYKLKDGKVKKMKST